MGALTSDVRPAPHDHVVQFYGDDSELVGGVVPYLAEAIAAGGVAVVIATPAHRAAFAAGLASAGLAVGGVDVGAAGVERRPSSDAPGSLVLLDAGEAMDALLVDGRVAPDRFEKLIGELIHDAAAGGRIVRAYGEIVAEMWAGGRVTAALELEDLWNGLGREVDFSLYCAYPLTIMEAGADAVAVHEVCRHHSAVIGERAETRTFAPGRRGASDARRFVTATLVAWGRADLVEAGAAVSAELASNAAIHARTEFTVSVLRESEGSVRVAVRDASRRPPRPRQAGPTDGSGRGLRLVEAFAAGWGADPLPDGKLVWARLRPVVPAAAAG